MECYIGLFACVTGSDADSYSDLTEWLNGIGVDSDVADKVSLTWSIVSDTRSIVSVYSL